MLVGTRMLQHLKARIKQHGPQHTYHSTLAFGGKGAQAKTWTAATSRVGDNGMDTGGDTATMRLLRPSARLETDLSTK